MLKKAVLGISVLITAQLQRSDAEAEGIKVLALQSPQIVLSELAGAFERRTGLKIIELSSPVEMPIHIRKRIESGVAFDIVILTPAMLDQLATEGRIESSTRTNFLRIPIGVAVKSGAAKPDISSTEAFKKTVLNARSIAYLKAGISGPHLQRLFERFGIAEQLQTKSKRPETDTVGELVAHGDAEIGITAISTLVATDGIDVVGPIPQELQAYVSFAGAISRDATHAAGAQELLKLLGEPDTISIIRRKGMEPWR